METCECHGAKPLLLSLTGMNPASQRQLLILVNRYPTPWGLASSWRPWQKRSNGWKPVRLASLVFMHCLLAHVLHHLDGL